MLQPGKLVQPVGPETAALATGRGRRRRRNGRVQRGRVDGRRRRPCGRAGSTGSAGLHPRTGRSDDTVLAATCRDGAAMLVIDAGAL